MQFTYALQAIAQCVAYAGRGGGYEGRDAYLVSCVD